MLDYIKEIFEQFTRQAISLGDAEITNHYSKLQSQADRGLLDEQFMKITPHNDLADLFEEFYNISMVKEEESKPRYTDEEIDAKISSIGNATADISSIGIKLLNKLEKSTTLKLIEMNSREIWSDKSVAIINELIIVKIVINLVLNIFHLYL